jgi:hypothetical protein
MAMTCPKCNGTGLYGASHKNYKCYACRGTGLVNARTLQVKMTAAAILVDATKVFAAFKAAQENKFPNPSIRADGLRLKASVNVTFDASIMVLDSAAEFEVAFLGRITAQGMFNPTRHWDSKWLEPLKAILADPQAAAIRYGMRIGACSICGRTLTNHESIDIGIGPICRGKMGWDSETQTTHPDTQTEPPSGIDLSTFDSIVKE